MRSARAGGFPGRRALDCPRARLAPPRARWPRETTRRPGRLTRRSPSAPILLTLIALCADAPVRALVSRLVPPMVDGKGPNAAVWAGPLSGNGRFVTFNADARAFIADMDADGDGLPNDFEQTYGLDPDSATGDNGAQGDPDGDGLTNAQERDRGTHPRGFFSRSFAEGAVTDSLNLQAYTVTRFLDTRFAVLNPGGVAATALVRFMRTDGTVVPFLLTVPARTRRTVDARSVPGLTQRRIYAVGLSGEHAEFSTVVESDQWLVVDRTMRWDDRGYGAHAETGVAAPALHWYLAEGATHSGFDLFYLLQNPNDAEAHVRIRFLRPSGAPLEKTYTLAATSRTNVWVNREEFPGLGLALAASDVSAVVEVLNGRPIIVERAMYLTSQGRPFNAGHNSAGVTQPGTTWFLAEGATGAYFDLFVLIANPSLTEARVEAAFLLPDGDTVTRHYAVAADSRFNIWVDFEDPKLADTAVSTTIRSTNDVPVIVERAMWWPDGDWHEAHNTPGSTAAGTLWALAEGEVDASRNLETYLLVANTSATPADVRVTVLFEDGTAAERTYRGIPANSRFNVPVGGFFPEAAGRRFGALVESLGASPAPIVVERAVYWDAGGQQWAAGTSALATRLVPPATLAFDDLADGGAPFSTSSHAGFTVSSTSGSWTIGTTYGHPAPYVFFTRLASEPAITAEVSVTAGGALFTLASVDVHSSVTTIPYELVGLVGATTVFVAPGTQPNTYGTFATVANPYPGRAVDRVLIRLTNPATSCCSNPVGVDNIVVSLQPGT